MADQVRTIIIKKELNKIRRDEEHQNENEDIGISLEENISRLASPYSFPYVGDAAPGRKINIYAEKAVETVMKKQSSLIDNRRTLKCVESLKFMEKVHRFDKVSPDVNIKKHY